MNEMKEESIDLCITSPPYDNLRSYHNCKWDFEIFKEIARGLWRVIKKEGVVVWIVNDSTIKGSETGTSFKQALYFKEIGFRLHDKMIWEKNSSTYPSGSHSLRYTNLFEYMFIFSKGRPKTTNLIRDKPNKYFGKSSWSKWTRRGKEDVLVTHDKIFIADKFGIRSNIWNCNNGSCEEKIAHKHPAIFPQKLIYDHLITWSNEGDIVLDCFAGSGTTLKVCGLNNRRFIGIEINEKYIAIIKERLEKHKITFTTL